MIRVSYNFRTKYNIDFIITNVFYFTIHINIVFVYIFVTVIQLVYIVTYFVETVIVNMIFIVSDKLCQKIKTTVSFLYKNK